MSDELPDTPQEVSPFDSFAGYPSLEHLVQGYHASGQEARKQRERAEALQSHAAQLEAHNQALLDALTNAEQNPARQAVPDRNGHGEAIPISEFDDHVARVLDSRLNAAVEARVNQVFAPIWTSITARRRVMARNPEYPQFEQAVWDFVQADPQRAKEYADTFARDPESAMTIAMLQFSQAEQQRHQHRASSNGAVDASIPTMRSGDGRRPPDTRRELDEAFARFQKTGSSGDAAAYAKIRLKSVVTDEFLNA